MDWNAIKQEYITTETSYRKLAKKYGLSQTAVGTKASEEGWVKEREKFLEKTLSKTLTIISKDNAKRAARLHNVADKVLDKIEKLVDTIEGDTSAFRQIAATLKDIKDIQMIKSDADLREQEARIAKLNKDAEDNRNDANDKQCGIILLPQVNDTPVPPIEDDADE